MKAWEEKTQCSPDNVRNVFFVDLIGLVYKGFRMLSLSPSLVRHRPVESGMVEP